jgi:hypothetical protein
MITKGGWWDLKLMLVRLKHVKVGSLHKLNLQYTCKMLLSAHRILEIGIEHLPNARGMLC